MNWAKKKINGNLNRPYNSFSFTADSIVNHRPEKDTHYHCGSHHNRKGIIQLEGVATMLLRLGIFGR